MGWMMVLIFFLLAVISVAYFFYAVCRRYRFTKLGRPENCNDHPVERWKYFLIHVIGHKKVREHPWFGLWHLFIMGGFLILLAGIPNMVAEGLFHAYLPYVGDNQAYLFFKDIFDALIIIGVAGVLLRRTIRKPEWLKNNSEAFTILILIFIIVLTELMFHSARVALGAESAPGAVAPLAAAGAGICLKFNPGFTYWLMVISFWVHFLAIFSLCLMVPRSKHLHLVFAPFNIYWHKTSPMGALSKIRQDGHDGKPYGANRMEDFTWKQLFDVYACTKCGRCNGQCPPRLSGETLKPKGINGRLRKHMEQRAPLLLKKNTMPAVAGAAAEVTKAKVYQSNDKKDKKFGGGKNKNNLAGGVFEPEFIWSCTTCGACLAVCPVSIDHISKLVDLRRYLVSTGNISPEMKQVFTGIAEQGNPRGEQAGAVPGWVRELAVPTMAEKPRAEYLYYAGCAAVFDETAQTTAAALVKILKAAGVDFAVPGDLAWCCGETARRMGNELLFARTVRKNIAVWDQLGIKKIITTCPHCYNTLKNEYPQFGGQYEVIHHSELLAGLLQDGKLSVNHSLTRVISYHDPCYLGRYNNLFGAPRNVLQGMPGIRLTEMPRTQKHSFCCGAGGGRVWTRPAANNLVTGSRLKEAVSMGAEVIGTACPFCKMVFTEALQTVGCGQNIKVLDIAEILSLGL